MSGDWKEKLSKATVRPAEQQATPTQGIHTKGNSFGHDGGQKRAGSSGHGYGKELKGGGGHQGRPSNPQGGGHGGRGPQTGPREFACEIHAPYNFVPLAKTVLHPEWQDAVSHDLPFQDGLCGEIEFTVTADTPILVGEEKKGNAPIQFFRHPDGTYAIPGSALRGMLRNVLEIATFSRMGTYVDDQWLAVRDLTPGAKAFYGSHITDEPRPRNYEARSRSGWLRFQDGAWVIQPCSHDRVKACDLNAHRPMPWIIDLLRARDLARGKKNNTLNYDEQNELRRLNKSIRLSAGKKYEQCLQAHSTLAIQFTPGTKKPEPHSKGNWLIYAKASEIGSVREQGQLIFTGQPGPNKYMEFIFHSTSDHFVPVKEDVSRAFLHNHKETDEWKWLKRHAHHFPHGIPVFYLQEGQHIKAIGLAQMFKLAYTHSIHGAIGKTSQLHIGEDARMDFVETLFGRVDANEQATELKGRVSFGDARLVTEDVKPLAPITTILNGPKPTYYPNYIVQEKVDATGNLPTENDDRNRDCGVKPKVGYSTLMDEKPQIRGWKRYPVRPPEQAKAQELYGQQTTNIKVQTQLQPLPEKTAFTGKLRFHNLKPVELGALVWALTWGGNSTYRHAIGMGKPFGYGRIRIEPGKTNLLPNKLNAIPPTLEDYRLAFETWIRQRFSEEGGTGEWIDSPQIRHLLAMADPEQARGKKLEHMVLDGERNNHFLGAKKAGLVLAPYI